MEPNIKPASLVVSDGSDESASLEARGPEAQSDRLIEDLVAGLSATELRMVGKAVAARLAAIEPAERAIHPPAPAHVAEGASAVSRQSSRSASVRSSSSRPSPHKAVWQEREPEGRDDAFPHLQAQDGGVVGGYRLLAASRRGKSHAHGGTYREDAFALVKGSLEMPWWFLAVSDGAGSHSLSRVGSNLVTSEAARLMEEHAQSGMCPLELVQGTALGALRALQREAERRGRPLADFSCTLLLLLYWAQTDGAEIAVSFQAGDGVIGEVRRDGSLNVLAEADGEKVAGTTHFLGGSFVSQSWERRFRQHSPEDTEGFLVATDGVSDDLVPWEANGPVLCAELRNVLADEAPEQSLLQTLAYEKRGSFDDRTLALAWRRENR